MAKVYVCRYGLPLANGVGLGEVMLADCISKLKINKSNYLGSPTSRVRFGSSDDALAKLVKGFGHVIVLVLEPEAGANGWKPGYYLSAVPAREAAGRLGKKLPPPPDPSATPAASTSSTA
jgi:hypothetical protein